MDKAARHLAVRLRFRRARADGRPGDEVGDVLRHDRVEKFRRRRQTQAGDFSSSFRARSSNRFRCPANRPVRVVDQTFPADGRARFFKIDAHDDFHLVGKFLLQRLSRAAYSSALFSSWIEHGPMTTSRRGSSCRKMRMTRSRDCATVAFTASGVGVSAFSARGESSGRFL
jgi:hypothetical protein